MTIDYWLYYLELSKNISVHLCSSAVKILYNNIMTITVDQSALKRIQNLRSAQGKDGLMLRITVDGGGCSGFQYRLELTDALQNDDINFAGSVVTDPISLPYLDKSVVRFEESLIGSEFKIDNPNAKSGCGCGTSFAV